MRDHVPLSLSIMIGPLGRDGGTGSRCIVRGFAGVKVKVGIDTMHDIELSVRDPSKHSARMR